MSSPEYAVEITSWKAVRQMAFECNSEMAELIDLGMKANDEVMVVEYDFSDNILKLGKLNLPTKNGGITPYDSKHASEELQQFMGNDLMLPFGLILSGYVETSSDSSERIFPLGWGNVGAMLGTRNFYKVTPYHFNRSWTTSSGTKYLCMLPNIKDVRRYKKLKEVYHINHAIPRSFPEQGKIFRDITFSAKSGWKTKVLFFSYKTLLKMKESSSFTAFRERLYFQTIEADSFDRDRLVFDFIWEEYIRYSERKGVKEKGYIYNFAKHLLLVAIGEGMAFVPAISDEAAPISLLEQAFMKTYKLKYFPTFMYAQRLMPESGIDSVYYSLQYPIHLNPYPSKETFSVASGLDDLRCTKNILDQFFDDFLTSSFGECARDSIISAIPQKFSFEYFHYTQDRCKEISLCESIIAQDPRFIDPCKRYNLPFCYSSNFFKGCVKITQISSKRPKTK